MLDTLRWGLLSTAKINDALIDPIRQAERSELVAVASRDAAKAAQYAQAKGISKAYGSYDALLADAEIDVVYISLPNGLHCEWTVKAAEAGKHVLCEKPITVTLEELDRVEAAAKANQMTVFEAFMYLHHPQTLQAQTLVQSGRLGQVQQINSWHHFYLPPENAENVRLQAGLSGGSLWDVGVYPVSAALILANVGLPKTVWANQVIGESGVDVTMIGQMVFANNVVAQVSSSFRTPRHSEIVVIGDEASLQLPEPWKPDFQGNSNQIVLTSREGEVEMLETKPKIDPYLCEVQAMEACILQGADPVVPLSLRRQFLRTVLALYASAESGAVVTL